MQLDEPMAAGSDLPTEELAADMRGTPSAPQSATGRPTLSAEEREELIRRRAHQIWVSEGQPEGKADEHWQRAARELELESGVLVQ